jgi:hypothetical protein
MMSIVPLTDHDDGGARMITVLTAVPPPLVAISGLQVEDLINQFWHRETYAERVGDGFALIPGISQSRVWADFQREFPQHVSTSATSKADKTRVRSSAPDVRTCVQVASVIGILLLRGEPTGWPVCISRAVSQGHAHNRC